MGTFTCAMKFLVIVAVLAVAEAQYQNGYQQQQQVQGSSRWYQNGAVEGNANQGSSRWNKNYPNQANNGNNGNNAAFNKWNKNYPNQQNAKDQASSRWYKNGQVQKSQIVKANGGNYAQPASIKQLEKDAEKQWEKKQLQNNGQSYNGQNIKVFHQGTVVKASPAGTAEAYEVGAIESGVKPVGGANQYQPRVEDNNGNQGDYQANDQAAAANVGPIEEQQTPETLQKEQNGAYKMGGATAQKKNSNLKAKWNAWRQNARKNKAQRQQKRQQKKQANNAQNGYDNLPALESRNYNVQQPRNANQMRMGRPQY